jgi:hypothetical protein
MGLTTRLIARHPLVFAKANLLLSLRPLVGAAALVRELFFTADTPQETVDACLARLQDESYRRVSTRCSLRCRGRAESRLQCWCWARGRTRFSPSTRYGGPRAPTGPRQRSIFPRMGHDMMLDVGWQQVADRIDAWVGGLPRS